MRLLGVGVSSHSAGRLASPGVLGALIRRARRVGSGPPVDQELPLSFSALVGRLGLSYGPYLHGRSSRLGLGLAFCDRFVFQCPQRPAR